jgi:hypothetical protein
MKRLILCALAFLPTLAAGQCSTPNGLLLSFNGERIGDPFALNLNGSPGVSGLIGLDDTAGPVSTPIGTVCLGLTPNLQFLPFTLDGFGTYSLGGVIPPLGGLIGVTVHTQAAAADPAVPGGFALSNGRAINLRPPRVFFIAPGYPSPFGTVNGSWCSYDAFGNTVTSGANPLPHSVQDAIMIPSLGWLAILLSNGTLMCFDAATNAPTLTLPILTTPGYPIRIAVEGTTLYVLYHGTEPSPFSGGSPGALRSYSLPTGAPGFTLNLASGENPDEILIRQGTGLGFLRAGTSVVPVNLVSGTAFPTIALGGASGPITEWTLPGNILYTLMPGSGTNPFGGGGAPPLVDAIDTSSLVALYPAPVVVPIAPNTATMMRYGPGPGINMLWIYVPGQNPPLIGLNPATLIPVTGASIGHGITEMELSAGGLQWLLLCNSGAGPCTSLQVLDPATLGVATVTPLVPPIELLVPIPSFTIRQAFTVFNDHMVLPFPTDLAGPPTTTVSLPVSSPAMRVVVD